MAPPDAPSSKTKPSYLWKPVAILPLQDLDELRLAAAVLLQEERHVVELGRVVLLVEQN